MNLAFTMLISLLITPTMILNLASAQPWKNKDKCISYDLTHFSKVCGACGLCQHIQLEETLENWFCDFSYLEKLFIPESTEKCQIVNQCNSNAAKDGCQGLKCTPMLGTFKCQCDSKRIGKTCQYNIASGVTINDYAVLENFYYSPYFTLNDYVTISLMFSSLGENLKIVIQTSIESLTYDSRACTKLDLSGSINYCKKLYPYYEQFCNSNIFIFNKVKWVFTAKIFYPGHAYYFDIDGRDGIRQGNIPKEESFIVGYLEEIKLSVYNKGENNSVFDTNFSPVDIVLSPFYSYCEPLAIIKEGGRTLFEIIKITRSIDIEIYALYKIPEGCIAKVEDLDIEWKVWIYDINHDETGHTYFLDKFDVQKIEFNAYSLEPARYKIRTNVTVWTAKDEKGFTVTYSYFDVLLVAMETIIQGGHSKSLYYKTDRVIINGSMSRNPNIGLFEQAEDLEFIWECDKKITSEKSLLGKKYIIYYGPFHMNEIYTFKLTVKSRMYNIHNSATQKITMVPNPSPTLDIICRKNCGGSNFKSNAAETIYLEVLIVDTTLVNRDDQFKWAYKVEKEVDYKSTESIRQLNTPSNVLVVLPNTLLEGETYLFRVNGGSNIPGEAIFEIKMVDEFKKFSCNLKSKKVIKGYFENVITCDRLIFDNLSPTYEYYDRFKDSVNKGRLIASNKLNRIEYISFTRGKLVVEVTNQYGVMVATEVNLEITTKKKPSVVVGGLLKDLILYQTTVDPEYKSNIMSTISDFIYFNIEEFPDASDTIGKLLQIMSNENINSYMTMKSLVFTLNILAAEGAYIELHPESVENLSKIMVKLSKILKYSFISSFNIFNDFTTAEIFQVAKSMINICEKIYTSKSTELENVSVREDKFVDLYSSYRKSSENNMVAIETTVSSLAKRTLPFMPPFIVEGENKSMKVWIKEDSPDYFDKISSNQTINESIPSVIVSRKLSNFLNIVSNFKPVVFQVVVYNGNPFWWHKDVISTNVVDLKIGVKKNEDNGYITELRYPIQINLDYQEQEMTIIEGTVKQPNASDSLEVIDLELEVHKIRVEKRGKLRVKFLNLKEGEMVKVLVLSNLRPYYQLIKEKGQNVTQSAPEYDKEVVDPSSEGIYDMYYLGIIPGDHVPAGQYMNYSFTMTIMRCVIWYSRGWSTRGCKVKDILSDIKQLQCECEHLSSFAGFIGAPINSIDPFEDYKLLLQIFDNPFVAIFIACLLIIYFILLFYTVKKDRRDRYKQCAIYLEDNLPDDEYPYLICVYTGARLFAGTTSNVGLVIEGENSASRPHILKSTIFKTLDTADDNWFIIFTPFHLGKLKLIRIWIDYSGWRPEWFCNKVVAVDLTDKKDYTFLINSWLSLRQEDSIEMFIRTETLHEKFQEDLASDNLVLGFREAHLWISIMSKHPRSCVNSSQRLSLAFCGLFAALLVSCMFYGVLHQQVEENSDYTLSQKEIIISVYSLIISAIITNSVTSVFRKKFVIFVAKNDDIGLIEEESPSIMTRKKSRTDEEEGTCLRLIQAAFRAFIAKKKFLPVHLEVDVVKKFENRPLSTICFEIIAWFVCFAVIIICAFFVVLYGLKFGKVKSLEWLSSILLSIGEDIFLASPAKIIIIAVVSGFLFSKIFQVIKYDLNLNDILYYKEHFIRTNPDLFNKVVSVRSKSIYTPLNYTDFSRKIEKQWKKDMFWLLFDIFIIGLLTVLLIVHAGTLWSTRYYWNNLQVKSLLNEVSKQSFQVSETKNIMDYLNFLEREIFPLIYQVKWYNGSHLGIGYDSSLTFSFSLTSTLFGLPRIRQHRQIPGLCRTNTFSGLPSICPSKLTNSTEDTDFYSEGWKGFRGLEKFAKSSAWIYKEPSETSNIVAFGYSSLTYNSGGYIVDLELNRVDSEDVLTYLKMENWIDNRTSIIIFEMTLYNHNTDSMSMVVIVTERLYVGMLMNSLHVFTVNKEYDFPAIDFILLATLCTFIVRLILVFNRRGFKNMIIDFWTLFEIVIVCLSLYCVYIYIKHIYKMKDYLTKYTKREDEQYLHFLNIINDLTNIQMTMAALIIMVACRFISSWRISKMFDIFFYTLFSAWRTLLWIVVLVIAIIFLYWTTVCYILNTFVLSRTFFIILHKMDFKFAVQNCEDAYCKVRLYSLCVISHSFTLLIIMHYVHIFRVIKEKMKNEDILNLCSIFYKKKSKTL